GPWPHWSRQPLWLTRTRPLRSACATSFLSRACTPSPSPSTSGQYLPLVQTKTWRSKICSVTAVASAVSPRSLPVSAGPGRVKPVLLGALVVRRSCIRSRLQRALSHGRYGTAPHAPGGIRGRSCRPHVRADSARELLLQFARHLLQ